MAESDQKDSNLLSLSGEIRNRIYRLIAVHEQPIQIYALPQAVENSIMLSPRVPALAMVCKTIYEEIITIFSQENMFHFTEYSLGEEHLKLFRKRARRSANKMSAVKITTTFMGTSGSEGTLIHLTLKATDTGIAISDVSYNSVRMRTVMDGICSCSIRKHAESEVTTLLDFLEYYLEKDGSWKGDDRGLLFCGTCNRYIVFCEKRLHAGEYALMSDEEGKADKSHTCEERGKSSKPLGNSALSSL